MEKFCTCIPTIQEDVAKPLQKELLETEETEYMVAAIRDLQKKNPLAANFISQFAMSTKEPVSVAYCALILYKLLEGQAEANALAQKWGE